MATGVDELTNDIENGISGVSEFVVNDGEKKPVEAGNNDSPIPAPEPTKGKLEKGKTDKYGYEFDIKFHKADKEGHPIFNKNRYLAMKPGNWSRKRIEKPKSQIKRIKKEKPISHVGTKSDSETQPDPLPEAKKGISSGQAGKIAADHTVLIGMMIGGDEWTPLSIPDKGIDEHGMLTEAYADYFKANGISDIPPGAALLLALAGYIVPRLAMPKTQKKTKNIFTWLKIKIWSLKNGTWFNTRNDRKRENDTGEEVSKEAEK